MQTKLFLFLLLIFPLGAAAQTLTIGAGAQFALNGPVQLTLHNTSLINHGIFAEGTSRVRFTGNFSTSIGGTQALQFFELEINKTNNNPFNNPVFLGRPINITQRLLFVAGHLNPNSFNIDLGSTGRLEGENDDSRIIGSSGGKVIATAVLNGANNTSPGNLGIFISSTQNMGNVTIRRGDQAHATTPGVTILRYYDIIAQNNNNLNATLRFHYLNAELYGTDENSLVFIKSTNNGISFTNEGFSSRNTTANYVEKSGINSFARFTLANGNYALPVHFTGFNARCEGSVVAVTWKTAQEQNSSHYNIEAGTDGVHWSVIGKVNAAGNSNTEKNYSFTYHNPGDKSYYRIVQYDMDGTAHYTNIVRSSCGMANGFTVWPNPFRDRLVINIATDKASLAMIRLFDSKGALVKTQQANLSQGNNQVSIETGNLSNGMYMVSVEWNKGQMKKAVQLLKR
ncbi:MAG TPA: T9SS type A sorting domain-containing protein [Chitinophagaceae bacterium]